MKKILFLTMALLLAIQVQAGCNEVCGDHIPMGYTPKGSTHGGSGKAPVLPWIIDLTNNVISMEATPCDYTLNLYDEDEAVVYSVFVPAGTTQVVLPTTLSGSFELRFETDTYYYYGFIYL